MQNRHTSLIKSRQTLYQTPLSEINDPENRYIWASGKVPSTLSPGSIKMSEGWVPSEAVRGRLFQAPLPAAGGLLVHL